MKKSNAKKEERNKAALEAIVKERNLVKEQLIKKFESAEEISVDTECKMVDFYTSIQDFNTKSGNFETDSIKFVLEKADKDMISFTCKYSLKK